MGSHLSLRGQLLRSESFLSTSVLLASLGSFYITKPPLSTLLNSSVVDKFQGAEAEAENRTRTAGWEARKLPWCPVLNRSQNLFQFRSSFEVAASQPLWPPELSTSWRGKTRPRNWSWPVPIFSSSSWKTARTTKEKTLCSNTNRHFTATISDLSLLGHWELIVEKMQLLIVCSFELTLHHHNWSDWSPVRCI